MLHFPLDAGMGTEERGPHLRYQFLPSVCRVPESLEFRLAVASVLVHGPVGKLVEPCRVVVAGVRKLADLGKVDFIRVQPVEGTITRGFYHPGKSKHRLTVGDPLMLG